MKRYGLVIAIERELFGVLSVFGKIQETIHGAFDVNIVKHNDCEIVICSSGIGEISSSSATQYLISKYNVDAILNFGFVGALKDEFKCQQIVMVKDVVHYDIDTSKIDNIPAGRYLEYPDVAINPYGNLYNKARNIFDIKSVRLASGDKFIASQNKKQWLIDNFSADICDMEGAGIILTANRNKIPSLLLKVISDNADENSPVSFSEIAEKGTIDCANILIKLIDKL